MRSGKNLARYVTPPLSTARLDRQWSAVSEQTTRFARRRRIALVSLPAIAAACVVALFLAGKVELRSKPVAFEGTVVETSGTSAQVLTLADGSRVEVAEATRLELASIRGDAIRLVLTRGSVDLDVTHVDGRTFVVSAGGFEVVVRGTRFRVALSDPPMPRLTVVVERGRVEARRLGDAEAARPIAAGETWTAPVPENGTETKPGAASEVRAPVAPEEPEAPEGSTSSDEARTADSAASVELYRFSSLLKARKFAEAYGALGPSGFARELARADAKRLLELSDAARFSGHPRDAAAALDRLRRRFRGDARAGLAALELGRLRMDNLGDPSGALEAFSDSLTLASSGAVREDAEAREVQALEALGDVARCSQARAAYLARYPNGVHVASIRGRCGAK